MNDRVITCRWCLGIVKLSDTYRVALEEDMKYYWHDNRFDKKRDCWNENYRILSLSEGRSTENNRQTP
jgi:hypothetical protein